MRCVGRMTEAVSVVIILKERKSTCMTCDATWKNKPKAVCVCVGKMSTDMENSFEK